ncbi:hypothetical protein [Nonomuraea sp. NPDC003804]|uniref:hypothetical protein n=1 Tax=Nonomuraea sp. NPDC003804 TaxID=3154547 RepID=UPI0033A058E5
MNRVLRWAALPVATAALASATLLPAASATAATSATGATTYTIELISLTCNKKQDSVGEDEPQLFINGVSKFGPGKMGKGDTEILTGTTFEFFSTATMELFDVDKGSNDDFLGSVVVSSSEAGAGIQVEKFDHLNGAEYTIVYEVD